MGIQKIFSKCILNKIQICQHLARIGIFKRSRLHSLNETNLDVNVILVEKKKKNRSFAGKT